MNARELRIIGGALGILAMIAAVKWYDWKLALIILVAIWSNNLERKGRNESN